RRQAHEEKIVTVEDPVEYQLHGVTQVPVSSSTGMNFSAALRSLLRQDPDVIMVGEMRDSETAEIAVQAAMTGHLVLSTLHTNDAISAIPRLFDLGIPPYLVAATLEGVLAQRLVRRLCADCTAYRGTSTPSQHPFTDPVTTSASTIQALAHVRQKERYSIDNGCTSCRGTGYRGRIGLYEQLIITEELREAISRHASPLELQSIATKTSWVELSHDGWGKVASGLTSADEVLRVLQA